MPVPPGVTVDVAAINHAMEQARAVAAVPRPQMGPADHGWGLTDEQIVALQAKFAEDSRRAFVELRAQEERERQGWRPDPNEPDVEIRLTREEAMQHTRIEARFRPRTGEQEQRCQSVVRDEVLALADSLPMEPGVERDSDRLLNEHIRMTVDRLCAERRRAEYERQQAERRAWVNNPYNFIGNFTGTWNNAYITTQATITNTMNYTYTWQNFAAATAAGTMAFNTWGSAASTLYNTNVAPAPPLTPAQRAEYEARQAKWAAEEKTRKAEWAIAEEQAEKLLLDVIGRHRFRIWKKDGVVHVSSRKYKNLRYEIKAGAQIKLLQREGATWRKRKDSLCIHPLEQYPKGDEVAGLYVLASFDEDYLWKTANRHGANQEPMPVAA